MSPASVERSVTVRFAPSPTGRLHPGNARTALINALFARRHRGRFLLRIDDTDTSREEAGAVDAIRRDLAWLGIEPHAEVRQSVRGQRYSEVAQELVAKRAAYEFEGAVRLSLGDRQIDWHDLVHGPMRVALTHQNDPVLLRADGRATFTLATVVDDLDASVSHVIRGDDHLTNTAVHLALAEALDAPPPAFAHLPLVVDENGAPLSKRTSSLTLERLQELGVEPEPLVAYLTGLGTGMAISADTDPAATLDLGAFGRASPTFDVDALVRAQDHWLETLDVDAVNHRLDERNEPAVSERLWSSVRGNLRGGTPPLEGLARLANLQGWRAIVEAPIQPEISEESRDDLRLAAGLLDQHPTTEAWLDAVGAATGRRGKRLRLPIRLALTARPDGPPLADLLALLGPERAKRRLEGVRA